MRSLREVEQSRGNHKKERQVARQFEPCFGSLPAAFETETLRSTLAGAYVFDISHPGKIDGKARATLTPAGPPLDTSPATESA